MERMNYSISDETIKLILSKVEIVDVIGEYVHLKKSGRNFLGLCPFHSEKTPSFSVSIDNKYYHCFGCGAGGNAISFLMEMEGYSFPETVSVLGEKVGVYLDVQNPKIQEGNRENKEKELVLKAHSLTAQLFHHVLMERNEGASAREYLENRGFQIETIKEFQIGFAPDSWDFLTNFLKKRDYPLPMMEKGGLLAKREGDKGFFDRFRGRVMFPIWDMQGNLIAFSGRLMGEGQPKYLNSPESLLFRKSRQLFNFHRARPEIRRTESTILVEGFADVLSIWQAGIKNVTATMGTSLSEDQARMIRRNSEQVIICYDGDQAGMDAISKASDVLEKQGCLIKVSMLPDGLDPDEYINKYGTEAFQREVINESKSYTAFLLEFLRKGRNLQDDGERMIYIKEALQVVSRLPHAVERDHYTRSIADEFALSVDALKQEQFQIYKREKRKEAKDNGIQKWNNNLNHNKRLIFKDLLPAFHNAERIVLAHMLQNKEIGEWIQEEVGSHFNIDEHSALAAYIYSYYAGGYSPDIPLFLSKLQDPALIKLATQLSTMPIDPNVSERALQDYVSKIITYPQKVEIEKKEEDKRKAERQGDVLKAALIATEILKMKNKLS
jgi:DNA primase